MPVTSRGGGTSIAGNAVGAGVVLDFSRHLNRVLAVDPEARTAVVEPGAVLDDITAAAARTACASAPTRRRTPGRRIGGSIGNNACGSRALSVRPHGRQRGEPGRADRSGQRLAARRMGRGGLAAAGPVGAALDALVAAHLGMIRTEFGRFSRQVSGYSIEHLLPENGADLAGSWSAPRARWAWYSARPCGWCRRRRRWRWPCSATPTCPTAADAVPGAPAAPPGRGRGHGRPAGRRRPRAAGAARPCPALPRGAGWLFVETAGDTEAEARAAAERLIADAGAAWTRWSSPAPRRGALWRIREDGAGLGGRTPAGAPAWPGWEDAAVPPGAGSAPTCATSPR